MLPRRLRRNVLFFTLFIDVDSMSVMTQLHDTAAGSAASPHDVAEWISMARKRNTHRPPPHAPRDESPIRASRPHGRAVKRRHVGQDIGALVVVLLGSVIFLSLFSFDPADIEMGITTNSIGPFGTHLADILLHLFGMGAFLFAGVVATLGLLLLFGRRIDMKPSEFVGQMLFISGGAVFFHLQMQGEMLQGHMPGGAVGALLGEVGRSFFGGIGVWLLCAGMVIFGVLLAADASFAGLFTQTSSTLSRGTSRLRTLRQREPRGRRRSERADVVIEEAATVEDIDEDIIDEPLTAENVDEEVTATIEETAPASEMDDPTRSGRIKRTVSAIRRLKPKIPEWIATLRHAPVEETADRVEVLEDDASLDDAPVESPIPAPGPRSRRVAPPKRALASASPNPVMEEPPSASREVPAETTALSSSNEAHRKVVSILAKISSRPQSAAPADATPSVDATETATPSDAAPTPEKSAVADLLAGWDPTPLKRRAASKR